MNVSNLSDNELIAEYLNGNHQMLECLITRHQKKVFSHILMVVKDRMTAEDLFQETFVKVILTLRSGTYKEEGKFIHWVMRIAHNITIDHFRKARKFQVVENSPDYNIFDTLNISDDSIEKKMITEQIHSDIRNLIDYLPDEQREVIELRHFADMSFKDIAEHTNVSINTALGRMRYAIRNLRKMVEDNNIILTA